MPLLQVGLVVATIVCLFVAGGALDRGFPIEVALARGLAAFIAVSFMGYLGELVVVTAPFYRAAVHGAGRHPQERAGEHAHSQPLALPPANEQDDDADTQQAA